MNKQQLANRIWASANKMRSKIEANEYKDYILGLIFYKFLSDNEASYFRKNGMTDADMTILEEDYTDPNKAMMIDYCQKNIGYFIAYKNLFQTWLQPNSTFSVADLSTALSDFDRLISGSYKKVYEGIFKTLQAGLSKLGENPSQQTKALKELIKLIKDIPTDGSQDYDVLGYVYEYLISNFAANAGKKAGEFYTPHEVAQLMSEIVANHHKNKQQIEIYDPTSGSGSLLITIGKSIGRHIADKDKVKYYAQELKENTYNLTRMNLVMRGILPSNIITRCADSLAEDWPLDIGNEIGQPLYVDAVVSNPPYSQHWDASERELDPRFVNYGVAPKSKADYAFLLHELHHLKPDGILTIVLPHGVLFRGGEEEKIRMNLIEKNNIDVVIGLPANIFFGTSIPTLIMVLKQHRDSDDVLIIDASKGFVKAKDNNVLRACDVKRIADTVRDRVSTPGFSRVVTREEIRKNGYNLNIPRYVDSSEPAVKYDIYATMFGGIPNSEIDDFKTYWQALPSLRKAVFTEEVDKPYSCLDAATLSETIANNADVQAFKNRFSKAFESLGDELHQRLITSIMMVNDLKDQDAISANIFNRLKDIPLVDPYTAYQALAERWQAIINDVEIIKTEGWDAARAVDPAYKIKKDSDGNEMEVPDGFKGRIMPFELVQAVLLSDELEHLNQLRADAEEQESTLSTLLESLDAEEQDMLLNDDNTKFDKTKVKQAWAEALADISTPETLMLDEYLALSKKKDKQGFIASHPSDCWRRMEPSADGTFTKKEVNKAKDALLLEFDFDEDSTEDKIKRYLMASELADALNKQIKEANAQLISHTIDTIHNLDDETIDLLLHKKWIAPVTDAIGAIPDAVVERLANDLAALEAKYAMTYSEIEAGIQESENSLTELVSQLTGDEYALCGLNEFVKAGKE